MERQIKMYDGKVFGFDVSEYGLENGYLDYLTLSEMVGACIRNNSITNEYIDEWEIVNGEPSELIHQYYIISRNGYQVLKEFTDELVYYNDRLDVYIWAIDHYGTDWDYVLTDVKLIEE
jgi:hypothetical protein